jgi:hypothetical protein
MRKLQTTAIGEPTDVLELVEFQAPAPSPPLCSRSQVILPSHAL